MEFRHPHLKLRVSPWPVQGISGHQETQVDPTNPPPYHLRVFHPFWLPDYQIRVSKCPQVMVGWGQSLKFDLPKPSQRLEFQGNCRYHECEHQHGAWTYALCLDQLAATGTWIRGRNRVKESQRECDKERVLRLGNKISEPFPLFTATDSWIMNNKHKKTCSTEKSCRFQFSR